MSSGPTFYHDCVGRSPFELYYRNQVLNSNIPSQFVAADGQKGRIIVARARQAEAAPAGAARRKME